ncbi:MarR family transcriptional regulator [Brucella abortus str. 2308 A]|uniref:Bacterial regulatory protein, MarR family n=14 Tax=Brucella TaxID=234 RepID=Q2YN99_BRUA2|nr:transcriptional regulator, MarR family [Brucella suis 1330]AAX74145.1 transcriptional regulator, MarR Family [Brucella abortus bv. 1 str. 9-941]ABY37866.1 transcriptional regulator, MarR family [Brucella suis ATCC 23445]ACO00556.1 transcriptional regulator, MarR family protein [Brucella melitensis ATCC 23457]ACU47752.1 transcriptional regulator, MarR family [Brucella microti CCM 4915]AEK54088.1 transcriptional regulator, MarR family [Brucella pinnipedialis B2/94]AEU05774.1 MarR family tran
MRNKPPHKTGRELHRGFTKCGSGREAKEMTNTQRKMDASAPFMAPQTALRSLYLEALQLVERLHRRLLDVVKDEFDRNGRSDINATQALLLFNIGNSELTAGELRSRGYYLGSNVSYNLKKLVEMGFIHHQRSRVDRRSVRVSLTDKGNEIANQVASLYERHITSIEQVGGIQVEEFMAMNKSLQRLDRFWNDSIAYRL